MKALAWVALATLVAVCALMARVWHLSRRVQSKSRAEGRHRHPSGRRRPRRAQCRLLPRQRARSEGMPDAFDFFTENGDPRS